MAGVSQEEKSQLSRFEAKYPLRDSPEERQAMDLQRKEHASYQGRTDLTQLEVKRRDYYDKYFQKEDAAAQTNLYAGSTSNQVINANPALKKISDRQIAQRKSELQEHLKSIKPGEPNLSWFQRALLKVAGESGSDPASESSAGSPLVPSGGAIKREGYVETLRKAAEQDEDPVLAQKYKDMNALRNGTYR